MKADRHLFTDRAAAVASLKSIRDSMGGGDLQYRLVRIGRKQPATVETATTTPGPKYHVRTSGNCYVRSDTPVAGTNWAGISEAHAFDSIAAAQRWIDSYRSQGHSAASNCEIVTAPAVAPASAPATAPTPSSIIKYAVRRDSSDCWVRSPNADCTDSSVARRFLFNTQAEAESKIKELLGHHGIYGFKYSVVPVTVPSAGYAIRWSGGAGTSWLTKWELERRPEDAICSGDKATRHIFPSIDTAEMQASKMNSRFTEVDRYRYVVVPVSVPVSTAA